MRALVYSDHHIHNWSAYAKLDKNGLNTRLMDTISVFDALRNELRRARYDCIIFAGDLFEATRMSGEVTASTSRALEQMEEFNIPIYAVVGNHDQISRVRNISSVEGLRVPSRWQWISGRTVGVCGVSIAGFDYGDMRPRGEVPDVAVMHCGVSGAMLNEYFASDGDQDLAREDAGKFASSLVICGHYHKPQLFEGDPTVLIPGAPLQHMWGDVDQDRGFWEVEISDEGVKTHFHSISGPPKFIRVDSLDGIEGICKGNFIDIRLDDYLEPDAEAAVRDILTKHARGFSIDAKPPKIERLDDDRVEFSETSNLEKIVKDYAQKFNGDPDLGVALLRRARGED